MGLLKREHVELLVGIGVLVLGLGLLGFTFTQALAVARAPGEFLDDQFPQEPTLQGPTASFTWDTNDLEATVVDTSRPGDGAIASWDWNFGDGTRVSGPNPSPHTYANASVYQVTLIVRDVNGKESRALSQVQTVPAQVRSGDSMGDPTAGLDLSLDFGSMLRPVAFSLLTFGMFSVMAIVGSAVTRAGWNLIKPKPETVRVRMKPRQLTQAFEDDMRGYNVVPPPPM